MPKDCCQQASNLHVVPSGRVDLVLRVCTVCGCRHFELSVDPGVLGVSGASL